MTNYLLPFTKLPTLLRVVWAMLLGGWVLAFASLVLGPSWLGGLGGGIMLAGFALAVADLFLRKQGCERTAGFHTGLCIGAVVGLVVTGFFLLLSLLVFVLAGFLYGFSLGFALRLLAMAGMAYTGCIIQSIGRQSMKLMPGVVK